MCKTVIGKLIGFKELSKKESAEIFEDIITGRANNSQIAAFLTALEMKKPSHDELVSFLKVVRRKCIKISPHVEGLVDTCGTGGDYKGTFNVSTAVAFIAAGAGVSVAKHGNRSASGRCGSADVLEAFGVNIQMPPEKTKEIIESIGIGFMFAPLYHPGFKHVANVRRELGFRTIFNYLGPLCNPANVKRQVIGVYSPELTEQVAFALKELGSEHVLVVHGNDLDEFTISGRTKITELKGGKIKTYYADSEEFGFYGELKDILGGDAAENKNIILSLLKGEKGPKRDIALLNAGAVIYVSGKASSIKEGIALAKESIDSGRALEKLRQLVEETNKCRERRE